MDVLTEEIARLIESAGVAEGNLLAILDKTLKRFQCVVGTIHVLDPATGMLNLVAQRGIPEMIMDKVRVIPIGKGMAGLAAERLEPVQVCNLQTDESGQAKPGAKLTQMEGSISFPMIAEGKLRGTMGVAKPTAYQFSDEEIALLMEIGHAIAVRL